MNNASYVIYAPLESCDITKPLYPKARYDEVMSCKNEKLRQEKYQVWKLLEKAVRECTSLDFDNIKFTKTLNDDGKYDYIIHVYDDDLESLFTKIKKTIFDICLVK